MSIFGIAVWLIIDVGFFCNTISLATIEGNQVYVNAYFVSVVETM
jgi:hypothetical protein